MDLVYLQHVTRRSYLSETTLRGNVLIWWLWWVAEFNRTPRWTSDQTPDSSWTYPWYMSYDSNHKFKTSNIRDTEQRKRCKYADFYQRQGFAFAPMICNTLGECGPDMLHFLWNLVDRSARHHFGFHPIEHGQDLMSQSTDHDRDFRKLRGKLFNDYRLRMQTAIFEAITMRVCGRSFALTCSANYRTWIRTLQTEWHPLFPLDIPLDSQHSSSVPQVQEDSQSTLASRRRPRSPILEGGDELSRRTRQHVSTEEGTTGDASNPASSMDWQL